MAPSTEPREAEEFQVTLRPDALTRLAEAAPHLLARASRSAGKPNRGALIGKAGATVTDLFKYGKPPENKTLARILKLHAQRRRISHGQAFDELFIVSATAGDEAREDAA